MAHQAPARPAAARRRGPPAIELPIAQLARDQAAAQRRPDHGGGAGRRRARQPPGDRAEPGRAQARRAGPRRGRPERRTQEPDPHHARRPPAVRGGDRLARRLAGEPSPRGLAGASAPRSGAPSCCSSASPTPSTRGPRPGDSARWPRSRPAARPARGPAPTRVAGAGPPDGGCSQRTFHALHTRNFRLFFVGQLISNTGNGLTNVALILFVLSLTHSGFAVGALAACQFGPLLLLSAWAGAVADRGDKRRAAARHAEPGDGCSPSALAVLAFHPAPSLARALRAGPGGRRAARRSTTRCAARSCPRWCRRTTCRTPWCSTAPSSASSQVFGPALAGVLATTLGFGWCFTLDAVIVPRGDRRDLVMMRDRRALPAPPAARTRPPGARGLPLRAVGAASCGSASRCSPPSGIFSFNFRVALPLFVTRSLHGTEVAFTVLYADHQLGRRGGRAAGRAPPLRRAPPRDRRRPRARRGHAAAGRDAVTATWRPPRSSWWAARASCT